MGKTKSKLKIREILSAFREKVKVLYGSRFKKVILYGSWARNEASENSDIDLIVVLGGRVIPGKEIDRMIDIITDLNLKYGVLISVYPISEEYYEKNKSPFLANVKREGVLV